MITGMVLIVILVLAVVLFEKWLRSNEWVCPLCGFRSKHGIPGHHICHKGNWTI